jgi:3-deoxy-7-phosphoheptulonate synthase
VAVIKLPSFNEICSEFKNIDEGFIEGSRNTIRNILSGKDKRFLMIVGPCSIYNIEASMDYAHRLQQLAESVKDVLFVVMRAYTEKSRTSLGWPGLAMEPNGPRESDVAKGLRSSRSFFVELQKIQLPIAVETVNPLLLPYTSDLVSWFAVGARNVHSQVHRVMASNMTVPVGFKNPLCGSLHVAVDAVKVATSQNSHVYLEDNGLFESVTSGNPWAHVVLRGGDNGPNYQRNDIEDLKGVMNENGVDSSVVIDCSHMNSRKSAHKQSDVLKNILKNSRDLVAGVMMESFLIEGRQDFDGFQYGKSVTDACIGWGETASLITDCADELRKWV